MRIIITLPNAATITIQQQARRPCSRANYLKLLYRKGAGVSFYSVFSFCLNDSEPVFFNLPSYFSSSSRPGSGELAFIGARKVGDVRYLLSTVLQRLLKGSSCLQPGEYLMFSASLLGDEIRLGCIEEKKPVYYLDEEDLYLSKPEADLKFRAFFNVKAVKLRKEQERLAKEAEAAKEKLRAGADRVALSFWRSDWAPRELKREAEWASRLFAEEGAGPDLTLPPVISRS